MFLLDSKRKRWIACAPFLTTRRLLLALMIATVATDAPVLAAELQPIVYHVEIRGFAFVPLRIEVHAGDFIEFTNRDFVPHTVTEDGAKWDTGALKYGMSGRVVSTTAGTFTYHCTYHPQMKGIVVVLPATSGSR